MHGFSGFFGTDMNGTQSTKWSTAGNRSGLSATKVKGISTNIKKHVDEMITIPMNGHIAEPYRYCGCSHSHV